MRAMKLQAVDQVRLNKDGKIMRPISAAQKFAEVIIQRLQPYELGFAKAFLGVL